MVDIEESITEWMNCNVAILFFIKLKSCGTFKGYIVGTGDTSLFQNEENSG